MNGDVGKRSCGDASPTSELVSQEVLQDVSDSKKHGSESHPSKMTDTMAESSDEMLQDSSEAVFSAPATEEEVAETQTETPNGESPEEKTKETQGSSSLAQKGGNDDTGQGLEEQPKTPQVVSEGSSQASKEPLTRDQIKDLVSQNVEYFFSRENWSSDAYLLSQMDSDQYVPVYILANCSQFKSITKDHSIILDALKESDFVQLDEENNRVRPNYKRCIVILREIPELTPVKEIEAMFEGEGCPKSISCEFVHNGFWYVTFESDSDAQKAYRYLRETVKTFKDKPILARIKTKPMSRIGCLSVLPSYGGKSVGGEAGERPPPNLGPGGNSNCLPQGGPPGNPGLQGVPNPPPPPPPNAYPPNNPQRMFYPSQNNMNASYPNYNFAASIQIPAAAYFYPNPMMQWPTPNFYDINSFIQYNGLSPRATYKPPANTRFSTASNNTNNMNRRNKNRDPKNNDSRHASGSGFNSGSQIRPNHPQGSSSRPHSSHSPHPYNSNHQSAHPNLGSGGGIHSMGGLSSIGNPPANQHGVDGSVSGSSTPKSIPPSSSNGINNNSNNNSNKSTTIPTSANGFAQNDLSLASQSNLYTSFSGASQKSLVVPEKPETGDANGSKAPSSASQASSPEDEESISRVSNGVAPAAESASGAASTSVTSSSSTTDASSASFSQSTARSESNLTSGSQAPSSSSQTNSSSGAPAHPPHPSFHHHHPAPPLPHPHPHHQGGLPVSHRSSFNGSENPHIRDAQPQRQMSRGGRRRVTRREDEMNGHSASSGGGGGGRGSQRTPGGGGADASSHKNAPNSEMKKPSFELQATSFPPLPSSEELAAAVPEEKTTPDAPQQTPWAGETHKFSDVMKGTAKPKSTPASAGGGADAESASDALAAPQATNSAEHPPPPPPPGPSAKRGGDRVPNPSSSTTSQSGTVPEPPSPSPSSRGSSGVAGAAKPSEPPPPAGGGTSSGSASSFSRVERGIGGMRGGGLREVERRSVGPVGARRERDFVPGVGRGGVRRADREGGGAGFRFSGNKENRPAPNSSSSRSWREDRPDPDGWITKGPRDPRSHRGGELRYQHQNSSHQHNYYENRNSNRNSQPMVNGDRSPPHSPQPETVNENVTSQIPGTPKSNCSTETKQLRPEPSTEKEVSLNNNEGEHKTSWAKMALASKDQMERLSAELKEKEEQERLKKNRTVKPPQKLPERVIVGREREGNKPFRRENNFFLREREKEREIGERGRGDFLRGPEKASTAPASSSSSSSLGFKSPREALVPKSPK